MERARTSVGTEAMPGVWRSQRRRCKGGKMWGDPEEEVSAWPGGRAFHTETGASVQRTRGWNLDDMSGNFKSLREDGA